MLMRYRDVRALKITTADGRQHRVGDLLVDDDLRLIYIVADLGGWFEDRRALVRASDFGTPDLQGGVWPANFGREDVRPAPDKAARDAPDRRPEAQALRAAGLEGADCSVGPGLFEPGGAAPSGRVHSVEGLLGSTVDASDREAGRLIDLIFDFEAGRATALVIETGLPVGEHQRVVPAGMLEAPDWSAQKLRLACTASRVDASPDLHDVPLERSWWNAVLSYYGI